MFHTQFLEWKLRGRQALLIEYSNYIWNTLQIILLDDNIENPHKKLFKKNMSGT